MTKQEMTIEEMDKIFEAGKSVYLFLFLQVDAAYNEGEDIDEGDILGDVFDTLEKMGFETPEKTTNLEERWFGWANEILHPIGDGKHQKDSSETL